MADLAVRGLRTLAAGVVGEGAGAAATTAKVAVGSGGGAGCDFSESDMVNSAMVSLQVLVDAFCSSRSVLALSRHAVCWRCQKYHSGW